MPKNVLLLFLLLSTSLFAQYDAGRYPVIPRPYRLLPFSGEFQLNHNTVIVVDKKTLRKDAEFFRAQVSALYGLSLKIAAKEGKDGNVIYISSDSSGIPAEGYQLFINRNEISLYGGTAGIFYGLQTILQLIHPLPGYPNTPAYYIPSCSILDQPRFAWRGLHLDVSRHFFPKENVKEYLRWMATYKLNTFHWHLTDDQGWRIEIKKYPKLTQVGAWRSGTLIGHYTESPDRYDTIRYGGYYTQADVREIVRCADSLHITVVPEIEMPGHTTAMLAAYPELGCAEGPFFVERTWGVFDDVLCPTEKTFSFLDDVLTEVAALFPGKYIHIGGDECPKTRWKSSAFCRELIKQQKLKDENELQAWFTQRIVQLLQKKGKQAIGWDEILEGGLAADAAVMSWRGEDGGIAAAKAGHFVVMSPGSHCYFDHYQSSNTGEPLAIGGFLPLEKVYGYNPVPATLAANENKFILGVQANLWTEYIGEWSKVQYMLFPRICALAEVGWSQQAENDFVFFAKRLVTHFGWFKDRKINYAKSIYDVTSRIGAFGNKPQLILATTDTTLSIRYSVNQKFETDYQHVYTAPITVDQSMTVNAATFRNGVQVGNTCQWVFNASLSTGQPATLRKQPHKSYNAGGVSRLLDGQSGTYPWKGSDWIGWWGDTLDVIIDLGKEVNLIDVSYYYLCDTSSWIYPPGGAAIQTSLDGSHFVDFGTPMPYTNTGPIRKMSCSGRAGDYSGEPKFARYVRVIVYPSGTIPTGQPGEGNPAWLFISEIQVR